MQKIEYDESRGSSQNYISNDTICYLCNIEFIEKNDFVNHVISIHSKIINSNYKCDICDSELSEQRN